MSKKQLRASFPYISVIIVCRPSETPSKALQSLSRITYPKGKYEILVIKGSHVSKQRNIALKESHGTIVYLLDNDSQVQPNALTIIEHAFEKKTVAAAGGPSISPLNEEIYVSKLIGYILETHFGALRMRLRYSKAGRERTADEFDLIGANLALRKKNVIQIGGFDETLFPNEETELLVRLKKKGYLLNYLPELFVFRSHRKTLKLLWKQFFFYGKGRAMQMEKTHAAKDIVFIIPVFFLFYLCFLPFLNILWWYNLPFFSYIMLGLATATKASIKHKQADLLITMPVIFPIIHLAYAWGLLTQLPQIVIRNSLKSKKVFSPAQLQVTVHHRNNASGK